MSEKLSPDALGSGGLTPASVAAEHLPSFSVGSGLSFSWPLTLKIRSPTRSRHTSELNISPALRGQMPSFPRRPTLVLVVEDEPVIRMMAVEVLFDAGFQVVEAAHAGEALDILRVRAEEFYGLFTDVHMPGPVDGVALAHEAARCWPWLGLLVASGRLVPTERQLPRRCRFLPKPYELSHLIRHVREMTCTA